VPALHRTAHHKHAVGVAVVRAAIAVFVSGSAKLGHADENDVLHLIAHILMKRGDSLPQILQKIRELSGRSAFVKLFSSKGPPLPIEPRMKMHIVNMVADGDYVMVSSVRKMRDTKDPNHIYSTTWFDMFRINDKGMIAEHWDPSPLWIDGKPPGAEFLP